MFETVATNGASILTMIALWSTLVWVATYIYMSERVKQAERETEAATWLWNNAVQELTYLNDNYGDVIDDYREHILGDDFYLYPATYELDGVNWRRVR